MHREWAVTCNSDRRKKSMNAASAVETAQLAKPPGINGLQTGRRPHVRFLVYLVSYQIPFYAKSLLITLL